MMDALTKKGHKKRLQLLETFLFCSPLLDLNAGAAIGIST